jgi:signal transduction histidine kinase
MPSAFNSGGRTQSNLRFSKKLAAILISGVVLLVGVIGATSVWISNQHNALARDSAERMVQGGFAALEEKLRTVILDYSEWTEAYDAIRARDMEWIYSSTGSAAAELGTTDLMIIVEPGGTTNYGWLVGSGEDPVADLLPHELIDATWHLLDSVPMDDSDPVDFYARVGDGVWLLAVSRVTPNEGAPEGMANVDLPHHIFGFRINDALAAGIGSQFFITDISVSADRQPGNSNLPLLGASGEPLGYVTWSPPRPGADILRRIALPLGLTLALLAAVAALASRHVVHSAQRLEQAVEADRRKTEFLANASHELRTPMNGVIGIAQLLERSGLDERQREMLKVLTTAAIEQMGLIENLLDVSRIDTGTRHFAEEPFQPARAVEEVLGIVTPEAERKGLELRTDLAGCETIEVLGDRDAFRRIVTNLVGNAVKFTQEGHVAVSLAASSDQGRARLTLRVEDTGPGIDPADQDRVFERFVRANKAAARKTVGTGLGLAITKSLVEFMGGEIALTSAPGEGAVFTVDVTLEIVERAEASRDAA